MSATVKKNTNTSFKSNMSIPIFFSSSQITTDIDTDVMKIVLEILYLGTAQVPESLRKVKYVKQIYSNIDVDMEDFSVGGGGERGVGDRLQQCCGSVRIRINLPDPAPNKFLGS